MDKPESRILRIGLAVTFIWIGVFIFRSPEPWGALMRPWVREVLPIPVRPLMIGTAILDVIIGGMFFVKTLTWRAASLASVHLILILVTTGITDATVRNIGLLAATTVLMVSVLPDRHRLTLVLMLGALPDRYRFWQRKR